MEHVADPGRVAREAPDRSPTAVLGAVAADAARRLRGRDLSMAAAGLTFFAGIAVVPCVALTAWLTARVAGTGRTRELTSEVAAMVPDRLGADHALARLTDAGISMGLLGVVVAALPASFYGEGLRRAMLRLAPADDTFTGWRGRVAVAPLVLVAPAVAYPVLLVVPAVGDWHPVAAVVVVFLLVWLLLTVPLCWVYRTVGPRSPSWPAVVLGSLATATCLSGFLQGVVIFVSLPLDLGLPFAGLDLVGAVVAVGLWLYVLHLILLLGWVTTLALDAVGDQEARA
jgi:membrane protein